MSHLKVALLQLLPGATTDENLIKGLEYCRKAKAAGADIALFPEMWSVGYQIPQERKELSKLAIAFDSDFVKAFGEVARELNMAVGITYLEKYDAGKQDGNQYHTRMHNGDRIETDKHSSRKNVVSYRNTMSLFDRFGHCALTYAKVHTCVFGEERVLAAGDDFYVTDLDTEQGIVKVGAMICYDREFPESARILMLKGAEIILVPNACPMEINRLSQLRGRAYENMVGIATTNYPAGQPDCNGHSSAFDGIAYRPEDSGSRDTLIIEADESEGIFLADFPLDEIRDYRSREVHGNAFRHPEKYGLLISDKVEAPFIRTKHQHATHTFGPIYNSDSEILILGSFPSVKSREQGFYYGHPQNRFWKVLSAILKCDEPTTIEEKREMLLNNHIALWDVIEECDIVGSSDSSIKNVIPTDIPGLLKKTKIKHIYANGKTAGALYQKHLEDKTGIEAVILLSTSPANAASSLTKLIEVYGQIVAENDG